MRSLPLFLLYNITAIKVNKKAHIYAPKERSIDVPMFCYNILSKFNQQPFVKQFLIISIMQEKSNPHIIFTSFYLFPKYFSLSD